jgi:hypothetical protein
MTRKRSTPPRAWEEPFVPCANCVNGWVLTPAFRNWRRIQHYSRCPCYRAHQAKRQRVRAHQGEQAER